MSKVFADKNKGFEQFANDWLYEFGKANRSWLWDIYKEKHKVPLEDAEPVVLRSFKDSIQHLDIKKTIRDTTPIEDKSLEDKDKEQK
jgi:hypothetical protein